MDAAAQWEAAGLYDPGAPRATERLELLEWFASEGVTIEEMVAANSVGQLNALLGDRTLRPGRRLTAAEVAVAAGMTEEDVLAVYRATGMPPYEDGDRVFSEGDLPMFHLFAQADAFFSRDELIHFVRVLGTSMRRIAEAASEMFLRDVEAPLHAGTHASEVELARANLSGVELARTATGIFDPMFRLHLEMSTRTTRRAREGLTHEYATLPITVGFVDLNGFTSRSSTLSPGELLDLVRAFESAATEAVSEHGGRLIKLIGDEVMFTAVDPGEACAIAASMVRHAAAIASGGRAGLAFGDVITSGGDVYGGVVNLASRIADIAVPGEVLVNEALTARAPLHAFAPAGRRQLKGFAEPVRLWSLEF